MKKFLISVVLITAAIVAAWKINYPSGSWRYKITVEVETPEGVKSGSAVREMLFVTEPDIFPEQAGFGFYPRGEAVVVDLSARGVLFVLRANELHDALPNPYYRLGRVEKYHDYIRHYDKLNGGGLGVLPQEKWPQMVMFGNINDPKSVKLVRGGQFNKETQKYEPVDNFEVIFGTGVKMKSITVEITDEPVTWEVKNWLPWLEEYYQKQLDGERYISSSKIESNLSSGSFSTGENR